MALTFQIFDEAISKMIVNNKAISKMIVNNKAISKTIINGVSQVENRISLMEALLKS